jgi:hypothetical protein
MKRLVTAAAFAAITLSAHLAAAAPCSLLAVAKPDQAKHRVYFTKFVKEDTSGGKYKACRIVQKADAGTETFYVTPFRQEATIVVHKSNWP